MQEEGLIEVVHGEALATTVKEMLADVKARENMRVKIKEFADSKALGRLADRMEQMQKGELPPLPEYTPAGKGKPELTEMSGVGLVSYISKNGLDSLSAEEVEYLTYRGEGYLASPSWQLRNIGVKLVGLLKLENHLPSILFLLNDKTPAPGWHRMLGGDFQQVGFLRRNAVNVLRQLGCWNEEVRETLLACLEDPYYEVRVFATRTCKHFAEQVSKDEAFLERFDTLIAERNFEVAREAILTLGEVDSRVESYEKRFRIFFTHPNWRIREAVARSLSRFVQRGVLAAETVSADLDGLLLTASDFKPNFLLREEVKKLSGVLREVGKANEETH